VEQESGFSDSAGRFLFSELPIGEYVLSVELAGFKLIFDIVGATTFQRCEQSPKAPRGLPSEHHGFD
jgi:hypothetical protein